MFTKITDWLRPPTFLGDEERTAQAEFLNTLGLFFLVPLAVTAVVYIPFFARDKLQGSILILTLVGFYFIFRTLLFRGRLTVAGLFIIGSVWMACEIALFIDGGLHSPMLFGLASTTTIVGMLFRRRWANDFVGDSGISASLLPAGEGLLYPSILPGMKGQYRHAAAGFQMLRYQP